MAVSRWDWTGCNADGSGPQSIRDVIAFPKTQKAVCLLSGAPSGVERRQLKDLFIKVDAPL